MKLLNNDGSGYFKLHVVGLQICYHKFVSNKLLCFRWSDSILNYEVIRSLLENHEFHCGGVFFVSVKLFLIFANLITISAECWWLQIFFFKCLKNNLCVFYSGPPCFPKFIHPSYKEVITKWPFSMNSIYNAFASIESCAYFYNNINILASFFFSLE